MPENARILWYCRGENGGGDSSYHPDSHRINILVIARRDKIPEYLDKIRQQLNPIEEELLRTKGSMTNSTLSYKLVTLTTRGKHPNKAEWTKILAGNSSCQMDRRLIERTNHQTLENYIDNNIQSLAN